MAVASAATAITRAINSRVDSNTNVARERGRTPRRDK